MSQKNEIVKENEATPLQQQQSPQTQQQHNVLTTQNADDNSMWKTVAKVNIWTQDAEKARNVLIDKSEEHYRKLESMHSELKQQINPNVQVKNIVLNKSEIYQQYFKLKNFYQVVTKIYTDNNYQNMLQWIDDIEYSEYSNTTIKFFIQVLFTLSYRNLLDVDDNTDIESVKNILLGRNGVVSSISEELRQLDPNDKKFVGKKLNELKEDANSLLVFLRSNQLSPKREPRLDPTLPGRPFERATQHPITATTERIADLFARMGFVVEEGPELETVHYNFDALNTPSWHPARDKSDTLYINPGAGDRELLRTETSPVQIHALERRGVPLRIISPGRVYRNDKPDSTHSPVFYQVEGLCVDRGISMADLKGTLLAFYRALLGSETEIRFRPHYFPFTEPSAEVDVTCPFCQGSGCRICKHSGFVEMGGCGMVHPNVLEGVKLPDGKKIDTEEFTGFAFGLGIERLAMLLYGIDDLRLFYENDIRFLNQF